MSNPRRIFKQTITRSEVSIRLAKARDEAERKRRNLPPQEDDIIYLKEPYEDWRRFFGLSRWRKTTRSMMRRQGI